VKKGSKTKELNGRKKKNTGKLGKLFHRLFLLKGGLGKSPGSKQRRDPPEPQKKHATKTNGTSEKKICASPQKKWLKKALW